MNIKQQKLKEQSFRDLWDYNKTSNTHVTSVQERDKEGGSRKSIEKQ